MDRKGVFEKMSENIYFTIEQLAKATGTSRATILRMEADGMISHSFREGRGNARYYDAARAMRVLKILEYRKLGFSNKETVKFFGGNEDYHELLAELKERLALMGSLVRDMQLRIDDKYQEMVFETRSKPYYYISKKEVLPNTFGDIAPRLMNLMSEAVVKGYVLDVNENAGLRFCDDGTSREQEFELIIHVRESCRKMYGVLYEPERRCLYTNYYGELANMKPTLQSLESEAASKNLKLDLPFEVTVLNTSFSSPDMNSDKMVLRVSIGCGEE